MRKNHRHPHDPFLKPGGLMILLIVLLATVTYPAGAQSGTFSDITVGTGSYGGDSWQAWGSAANTPTLAKIMKGTSSSFVSSTSPIVSFATHLSGDPGANGSDIYISSNHSSGTAAAVGISSYNYTAGYGAGGLQIHTMAERGTSLAAATSFPLWITCDLWDAYDKCSNEINVENNYGSDPPSQGEYGYPGFLNGLALIVAGGGAGHNPPSPAKASSALYIGTQDTTYQQWQRGIDFQQASISNYAILLPNGVAGGIHARDSLDSSKYPMLWLGGGGSDTSFGTGGWYYWYNAGLSAIIATLDASGHLKLASSGSPGNTLDVPSGSVRITSIKSTTGTRYVCVNSSGDLVSSTTACSGT